MHMMSSTPSLRPTLMGDLQFPTIQFHFNPQDPASFLNPNPPNPQSFAFQNAEEQAGWRRRERVIPHYRKRNSSGVSPVIGCPPPKQRRTDTKSHVSGSMTLAPDIPLIHCNTTSMSPIPGTSTQHQSPNDLLVNWKPFAASESNDIEMCNSEMQGLNILPRAREPVVLTIDVTGYAPEQISFDVSDGQLSIAGKRQEVFTDHLIQHKFTRVYNFPEHFDARKILTDFSVRGLLRVVCPYIEEYNGMIDGDIELEVMDSDRTVIKKGLPVPCSSIC